MDLEVTWQLVTWSDFPTGGGAPGLSLSLAASVTTYHARHVQSEALQACQRVPAKPQFMCLPYALPLLPHMV